jgi:D-lactate dehydrogenase
MTPPDLRSFLASRPLLATSAAETVDALAARAARVDVAAGELAFREGDPAPFVFLVVSGTFEVLKRSEDGTEISMRTLGDGEVGGLTNLSGGAPRSASLRAKVASVLLAIDKATFREAMRGDAALTLAVLEALGRKIRAKNALVATLTERGRRDPRESIVFFDAKPYEREAFERHLPEDLRITYVAAKLGRDTARLAEGYAVVCAFVNDDLGRPVLEELAALGVRLVAMRCAGTNNVDLAAASALGLAVVRVPAYSPHAVAEHTIALLLTLVRRTHKAYARVREGNFSLNGLVGFDLHGKTAGIVGTGKIGAIVARILLGFGMEVLAFDEAENAELALLGVRYVPLDELFARSDVVSLHVPLTPVTHHLVNATRIARAKRGLVLLNTSRGGLVDASALVDALKTGQVSAAGLDVYEEESAYFFQDRSDRIVQDDLLARLMSFPDVLITGHQGFLTREALGNIAQATLASVGELLSGEPLTRQA